ncbi:MAG TPA: DUF3613 domain-containing protein, partial [Polyangia bacterium]|nr:DUF3613 domain-containing protein [Polyangia bacterium]
MTMRRLTSLALALALFAPAVGLARPRKKPARRPPAAGAPAPAADAPLEPTTPDEAPANDERPAEA